MFLSNFLRGSRPQENLDDVESIMPVQCLVLRFFGMISTQGRIFPICHRAIGLILIICSCLYFGNQIAEIIIYLSDKFSVPIGEKEVSPVVTVVQDIALFIRNARTVLLVAMLFFDQSRLMTLFTGLNKLILHHGLFSESLVGNYRRTWRRFGLCLSVFIISMFVGYEIYSWYQYRSWIDPQVNWLEQPSDSYYLGPKFTNLIYLITWELFETLPLLISVQLYVCLVTSIEVLSDSISEFVRQFEKNASTDVGTKTDTVSDLIAKYEAIADFNDCINETLGFQFWFMFYADLATMIAYITGVVAGSEHAIWDMMDDIFGFVSWLLSIMIMLQPCIKAYEKGQEVPKVLYVQLVHTISHLNADKYENYCNSVTALMNTNHARPIVVNGYGLLLGTRRAMVAVFSLVGTFLIIFDEIAEVAL